MDSPTDVFIDGGGNSYQSVTKYLSWFPAKRVYVFEPNPVFHASYAGQHVNLVRKAIWTNDGHLPFYVSRDERQVASSLLPDKLCKVGGEIVPYWHAEPLQVECVDFSMWLAENVTAAEHVTVKLDIEGAEHDVLWKLIEDGTITLIDKLYVEFHLETVVRHRAGHDRLMAALRDHKVEPYYWD